MDLSSFVLVLITSTTLFAEDSSPVETENKELRQQIAELQKAVAKSLELQDQVTKLSETVVALEKKIESQQSERSKPEDTGKGLDDALFPPPSDLLDLSPTSATPSMGDAPIPSMDAPGEAGEPELFTDFSSSSPGETLPDHFTDVIPEGKVTDLSLFNPEVSVAFDFIGAYSRQARNFNFTGRDVEVMIQSNIDQFARAVFVFNAEDELNPWEKSDPFAEFSLGLEEAYIEATSLLPYGLNLKAGVFFADFTRLGKVHGHELPFTDRPDSLGAILGDEDRSRGVEINWVPPAAQYLRVTGGVVDNIGAEEAITSELTMLDGESTNLFRENSNRSLGRLMYYTRAATIFELGSQTTLNLGANIARGGEPGDRRLMSTDIKLTWLPDPASYDSLVIGGEFLHGKSSGNFDSDALFPAYPVSGSASADGAYLYAQYNRGKSWEATIRQDWLRPDVWSQIGVGTTATGVVRDRETQNITSAYLGYKFDEFSRLRLGVSHVEGFPGAYAGESSDWLGFLQWSVIIGPHHHAFQP